MNREVIKNNQRILSLAIVFIAVFALLVVYFTKGNVVSLKADISSLKIKNNIIILNKYSTKQSVMTKTGELNLTIFSGETELSSDTIIKTNDVLKYNNNDYNIAVLGDANADGDVDIGDITRTYKVITHDSSVTPTTSESMATDSNEDSDYDIGDITRTYKIFKGLVSPDDDINPNVTFTVSFNSNGGSAVDSVTKYQNETIGELPTPTKEGCTFEGWYNNEQLQLKIAENTKVTQDITYYAKWQIDNYTISFDSKGGSNVEPITKHLGDTLGTLPTPTKDGYELEGWYQEETFENKISSSTTVTGNATYYANWILDSYTISFDTNGGNQIEPIQKSFNVPVGELPTPTRQGYTFIGWYTDNNFETLVTSETIVTSSTTYYARWGTNTFTITYDAQIENGITYDTKETGETLGTLPVVEREGYVLVGWFTDNTNYTTEVTMETEVYGDATYYAKWAANSYTVSFDSNGGTGGQTATVTATYGDAMPAINTTAPVKEHYIFMGWYDEDHEKYYNADGTSAKAFDKIANTTLYAQWTITNCTLLFDTQVDDNIVEITKPYNSTIDELPEVSREGYVLVGWFTDNTDYTTEVTTDTVVTGDTTYYAKWEVATVTIYLDMPEDADGVESVTRNYNEMVGTLPTPTRDGYSFEGWYEDEEYQTPVSSTTYITEDVTYYSKWETRHYIITFDSRGGSNVSSRTYIYNEALGELPTPTKEGYTLDGWYTNIQYTDQVTSATLVTDEATYFARWIPATYRMSFNANGGTGGPASDISVTYEEELFALNNEIPTKEGYEFTGWYDGTTRYYGEDGYPLLKYNKTSNTTLTAGYREKYFSVTFDANGGELAIVDGCYNSFISDRCEMEDDHSKVTILATTTSPNNTIALPQLYYDIENGKYFDGWYTSATGGTSITSNITVDNTWTENKTYYAHWASYGHPIYYGCNLDNSDLCPSAGVKQIVQDYYTSDELMAFASSHINLLNMTRSLPNGSDYDKVLYSIEKDFTTKNEVVDLLTPVLNYCKSNYANIGNNESCSTPDKCAACSNLWTIMKNGGSITGAYNFGELSSNFTLDSNNVGVIKKKTNFQSKVYNLKSTYSSGDNINLPDTISYDEISTFPTTYLTYTDYDNGFYLYPYGSGEVYYNVSSDFKAKSLNILIGNAPTSTNLTVDFNLDGGSGTSFGSDNFDEYYVIPDEVPTKNGWVFGGWTTTYNGTDVYQPGDVIKSTTNLMLYANWTHEYTITYNANGPSISVPASQSYIYAPSNSGKTITLSNYNPELPGYVFLGWSEDSNAGTPTYYPGQSWSRSISHNTTLYAVWDDVNVLFIGDSKTYYNYMPLLFKNMRSSVSSHSFDVSYLTPATTISSGNPSISFTDLQNFVKNTRYDYVVIQDGTISSETNSAQNTNVDMTYSFVNNIKNTVRNTSGTKSANAKFVINTIWRDLDYKTTYHDLCSTNTGSSINNRQNAADQIALRVKEAGDIVVLSGRQLFDYECSQVLLNINQARYSTFRNDLSNVLPSGSYLEAGLLYSAIYGYPTSDSQITVTGYNATDNTYNTSNTFSWSATTQQGFWNYIRSNRNYIR